MGRRDADAVYREEAEITIEPPIVFEAVASRRGQIFARLYFEVEPDADEEAARVPNMSNPVGNTVEKFRSRPVESRRGGGNGTERARARIRAHDLIIFIQPRCSMAGLNIAARPLPLHPVTLQIVGLFRVERAAGEGGICCPV